MNFDLERQKRISEIEEIINRHIPTIEGEQHTVIEAMNYALMAGGKRIRPMLMAETFRLFGGKDQAILEPFMAAIEMIHTYSLVHDDLPCMDDDDYRRGRKTTHMVYGEAMALLAGDGLLNYAFETAAKAYHKIQCTNDAEELTTYKRCLRAVEILTEKAGIAGMIGGQVIDMEGEDKSVDRSRLDLMYRLKTGALIEASMMIGAVLAGVDNVEVNKIEQIAGDIGLAFQIRDDILDVTSTTEVLGKPVHSDEKNNKVTYVTLMEIEQANQEAAKISERAITVFEQLPYENEYLKTLINKLINREN